MAWGAVFRPQSPQVQVITTLFAGFLIRAAVILLVVAGLVIYSVVRYRERECRSRALHPS
jgi:heme/copper-type cytochrome/quinol oxidase subunit 2